MPSAAHFVVFITWSWNIVNQALQHWSMTGYATPSLLRKYFPGKCVSTYTCLNSVWYISLNSCTQNLFSNTKMRFIFLLGKSKSLIMSFWAIFDFRWVFMVILGVVFGGRIRDRLRGNGNTANQTWCKGRLDGLYPHPDQPQRFIQVSLTWKRLMDKWQ